ncbi:hypothetical protein [Pseudomonas sp. NFACC07-1]|uniref:hypothetical protein n=1 Tax=Pseudomonas sp. NFACC07-1 TaxID=1566239 RepID=UPI0008CD4E1D|nr:hypothetical protein [Pseudomonas sp. NFACC07-1]SEI89465.1 hypothetical protein SAMN03159298_01597 [Pseudomonas sp. NFACC07-1]
MKHKIMGVTDGDDFASYEKTLCIDTQVLAKIMSWTKEEDYFYDYELNTSQIKALESECSIELPRNLLFFLTSSK